MEVKQLYEILEDEYKEQSVSNSKHWNKLWDLYVEEKSADYQTLPVKEAIPRMISDQNLRIRRHFNNCIEMGLSIRVVYICFIDYGEAYINEIV